MPSFLTGPPPTSTHPIELPNQRAPKEEATSSNAVLEEDTTKVMEVTDYNKKKKRDRKGKEVAEEGEVVPFKELEPQKGAKLAKGAQRKSSSERVITKWVSDHCSRVPV
nr:hypothetical protein CFP56_75442 [Quercus suber]